jgi:hypothetical protein
MPRLLSRIGRVLVGFTLLGAVGAIGAAKGPVASQPARAQEASGDYSLLLQLAQSLLAPGAGPDGQSISAQILPGALPSDLSFSVPQPSNSTLVGSVVRSGPAGESSIVVLTVPGSAADVISFYGNAMTGLGWAAPPATNLTQAGFLPSSLPPAPGQATAIPANAAGILPAGFATFCQSSSHLSLGVSVWPTASGPNDVQIEIGPDSPSPCVPPPAPQSLGVLPALSAPSGAQVQPDAGQANAGRASSDAIVTSSMNVADLAAAYAQQLAAAGWTQVAGQDDGPVSWSTWSLPSGGDWQGFLLVQSGGQGQQIVHVEAISPSQELQASAPPSAPSGNGS